MDSLQQQPETSLQSAVDDPSSLLMAGIQAVNASLENQRMKDQNEYLVRLKAMEANERQLERMLTHDWKKCYRVFWLSALCILAILAIAAGLIFISKDVDKGVWLITSTIIGVLALLAGRGLARSAQKPPA